MSVSAEPFGEDVGAQCRRVDEALARFLPSPPACPPALGEAMRYSVFAGGKRFRPVLVLAAAEEVAASPALHEAGGVRDRAARGPSSRAAGRVRD